MLTEQEHIDIARDLLIAINHGDADGTDTALLRVFAPGTDKRDGYVLACGLIAGITNTIPRRPGVTLGLQVQQLTHDGPVPGDIDQAPPFIRAVARWTVAAVNRDHATTWAVWQSVVSGGPEAIGEFLGGLSHQAAQLIPCPCGRPR